MAEWGGEVIRMAAVSVRGREHGTDPFGMGLERTLKQEQSTERQITLHLNRKIAIGRVKDVRACTNTKGKYFNAKNPHTNLFTRQACRCLIIHVVGKLPADTRTRDASHCPPIALPKSL